MQEVAWLQNKEKRLLGDTRAREEELRKRREKEERSGKLEAWQEAALRGCKTSQLYEKARKRWDGMEEGKGPSFEEWRKGREHGGFPSCSGCSGDGANC